MLVLSRKIGERVVVPDCGLSVTIVSVKGNTVRVGIGAPAGNWRLPGRAIGKRCGAGQRRHSFKVSLTQGPYPSGEVQ